jgi:sigma-B regulation protein RsbU (phosphoserine phosphatase)
MACVAFTLAGAWLFAALNAAGWVDYFFLADNAADVPVRIQYSDQIDSASPPFVKAGAARGDRILAVQGRPFTGFAPEYGQLRGMHAGDLYTVRVQKPDGRILDVTAPLAPLRSDKSKARRSLVTVAVLLQILFPVLCLALGTWVLLARPQDVNAWYVFTILHYMQTFFGKTENFAGPPLLFMAMWSDLWQMLFLVAVLFFGLDFPQRFRWEVRRPWLRWILAGPLLFSILPDPFEIVGRLYRIQWFRTGYVPFFHFVDAFQQTLGIACVSLFCALLFSKFFNEKSPDARRRLRILVIGSQVGLWPTFIILLISKYRGVDFNQAVPWWLFLTALFLFTLLPFSLAYAIIVERAMDVRVLLRQGTQYALARGTLRAVRIGLTVVLAIAVSNVFRHRITLNAATVLIAGISMTLLAMRYTLEKRAQTWIDRKFFRESYAAEQVLSELMVEAGQFTETAPLLETVARRISDTLHVENMAMLLRSGNGFRLQTAMGVDIPAGFLLGDSSQSVNALQRRHGPATVYFDRPDDWLMDASAEERAALRELNVEVLLPLPGRGRLMGVMALGPKRSEQPYSRSDLQLLTSVGTQTGMALENSELLNTLKTEITQRERMNRELEIAHEVQERLFPQSFPVVAGVQVAGSCRPAQGVGGDYYDCIMTGTDGNAGTAKLALAIGDVSGKGVSAALLMASLRASLRGQTMQGATNLAQVVSNVNALLYESSASNRYATFFFGEYDPTTRKICFVNAGHNPPVLLRPLANGKFERHMLAGGGPVVGLVQHAAYEQCELQMQSGDLLLLYTDGISEAMDPLDEEWGEERMTEEAERLWPLPAQEVLNGLVRAADAFAAGAEQHDDMTLMVMKLD